MFDNIVYFIYSFIYLFFFNGKLVHIHRGNRPIKNKKVIQIL